MTESFHFYRTVFRLFCQAEQPLSFRPVDVTLIVTVLKIGVALCPNQVDRYYPCECAICWCRLKIKDHYIANKVINTRVSAEYVTAHIESSGKVCVNNSTGYQRSAMSCVSKHNKDAYLKYINHRVSQSCIKARKPDVTLERALKYCIHPVLFGQQEKLVNAS